MAQGGEIMIGARQIAFGRGAGKRKPYDAEVEYLESTGTQYIDTGLNSTADSFCDFEISFRKTDLSSSSNKGSYLAPFGYRYGAFARYGIWGGTANSDSNLYVGIDNNNKVTMSKDIEWHSVKVENGVAVTIDGVSTAVGTGSVRGNIGLLLFATINSASEASSYIVVPSQIAYCKIWNTSGDLIRDFIPVRVGSVGYMYDRVSGQLFGNSGEGEFVLGPDVIESLPVDFVQDGLQVCFDGRVGLDVGNGSWKELVSGITYSADMVNTHNNEVFTGASRLLTPIRLPFNWSDGFTLQYTVYIRGGDWDNKNPIFAADGDTTSLALTVLNEGTATDFMYDSVIDKLT
ncbi:MAG: hypothetical protein IKW44_03040, partial [Bacteroidaceae bacterium]|nr:hypothetical protein [Bacteroidaceae bacterium]